MSSTESPPKPKRKRGALFRRWLGRIVPAVVLVAVLAVLVISSLPRPVPVDLDEVHRGKLEVTVSEDGRTRVKDRYVVGSPLLGNLARVELRPGDTIEIAVELNDRLADVFFLAAKISVYNKTAATFDFVCKLAQPN